MYKYLIITLSLVFLYSCNRSSPEVLAKEAQIQQIRDKIAKYCYLEQSLDDTKDWNIAIVYFDNFFSSLNKDSKQILDEVVNLHRKCNNEILIVGHSSNTEANSVDALELSYNRANIVYKYLISQRVLEKHINALYCSNLDNRFFEYTSNESINEHPINKAKATDIKKAMKYNQRVEIIFLNPNFKNQVFDCLGN